MVYSETWHPAPDQRDFSNTPHPEFVYAPYTEYSTIHALAFANQHGLVVTDASRYSVLTQSDEHASGWTSIAPAAFLESMAQTLRQGTIEEEVLYKQALLKAYEATHAAVASTRETSSLTTDAAVAFVHPGRVVYSSRGDPALLIVDGLGNIRRLPHELGLSEELLTENDRLLLGISGPLADPAIQQETDALTYVVRQGLTDVAARLQTISRLQYHALRASGRSKSYLSDWSNPAIAVVPLGVPTTPLYPDKE
jgi:hypothetical protein